MPSRASGKASPTQAREPSDGHPEIPLHLDLYALVIASARSGFPRLELSLETRERLAGMNDPLARFLKSLVGGGVPPIPPDLPEAVRAQLAELLRACAETRSDEPESE